MVVWHKQGFFNTTDSVFCMFKKVVIVSGENTSGDEWVEIEDVIFAE